MALGASGHVTEVRGGWGRRTGARGAAGGECPPPPPPNRRDRGSSATVGRWRSGERARPRGMPGDWRGEAAGRAVGSPGRGVLGGGDGPPGSRRREG